MLQPGSDEMRKQFRLPEDFTFLNNGGFGWQPNVVVDRKMELLREQMDHPGRWFRVKSKEYYNDSVKAAASFVGAEPEDLFVVDNVTTGTNAVLKSLKFERGSEILLTTHTYPAVLNTAADIEKFGGLIRRIIKIPIPISSEEEIFELYEKNLSENPNIKIAIIDHITSPSAIVLPVKKLTSLCRKYDVITLVDGAHAPGQIKLDMKELGGDFYVGNFHKWAFSAVSCAFLWVSTVFRGQIYPPITSRDVKDFHERFYNMGTRDYSSLYTLPTALQFYKDIGGLKFLTSYADDLITSALEALCCALGTKPLDIPCHMRAPCMAILALPPLPDNTGPATEHEMSVWFSYKYSIQVAFYEFDEKLWLRISAGVYNRLSDYFKLRDALIDFYQIKI